MGRTYETLTENVTKNEIFRNFLNYL